MAANHAGAVYPRVCGGTPAESPSFGPKKGLSPRVRGNPMPNPTGLPSSRSIPACAGEPPGRTLQQWSGEVYPRVCGGTIMPTTVGATKYGLSPRVRGNPAVPFPPPPYPRSIPACAGEPVPDGLRRLADGVYPRVCGGTLRFALKPAPMRGLSPRVRGNPVRRPLLAGRKRSIPACAGEPWASISSPSSA